jgi:hypothetical protein
MKYILLEKNFIMKANRNFNKFNKFKNKNYDKTNIKQPIKIPELYYLSYFLKDSKKDGNKNKIKKYFMPLLTIIVEDKDFNKNNLNIKKSFSVIIKNKYRKLPIEFKEEYIKNQNIFEEEIILNEKIEKSFEDAIIFLRDFRNIMIHKNIKEDTFSRCNFKNFDGELFSFLRICLKSEYKYNLREKKLLNDKNFSSYKTDIKENYIDKVLQMNSFEMKNDFKNIPFIYALIILAMFTESKYIKELLDLIKVKKFIKDIVLSFSLRGDYKTLISGIISEEEKLYFKQLEMSEQIYKETYSSGKRAIKKLDYFNYDNKDKKYNIYDNVIRFYTYINSFPKIKEFESDIREFKANEIVKSNINTMNSIKEYNQNAREYNNKIERGFIKLAVKRENNNLKTDYKKIIPTIKNVFREEDIFMKEAIEFLSSKYSNEFGKDTWTISGNAVIWLEPNDNICFDVRRKVKPSKNGMNSIYKIVYNEKNSNRYSLNRYNLRALITSILINGDLSFKDLKDTATSNLKVKNHNSENTNNLSQDLKNKIPNWNRYKKASLIVKTVRKSIIKDIHLHNKDSVGFYKEFIRILYKLDSGNSNIYDNVVEIINKYGIPNENLSEEIIKLLKYNNLKDMALASVDILVSIKKKKEIKKSIASFKTWSKFAFLPVNQKNQNIYSLLGWENIKNNLLTENSKADIFEILFNYFKKNNIAIPTIVGIYQNYIKNNKINYYEEKEIRNIIAEEMILYFIYLEYIKNIETKNKSYFYFESSKKDNNILDFDLIWDLNPKIKINIKDYIKRDTKQSLDFIFDIKRIKEDGKINGKEDLQKCLESCLSNYNIIINHNVFKSKCPKPTSIIQNNILNANNIIDIVKVLRWAQKELLYFICGVETYLIYKLSISLTEHQFKSISEEKGYIDFKDLIDNYNKSTDKKLEGKLSVVKNILAHGILSDYDYNIIVDILDSSLSKLNLSSLYENYNKKLSIN